MIKNIKRVLYITCGIISLTIAFGLPAQAATMGSHYPFGGEGVTAGSAPPPGFHYRGYLTLTNPTTYKDDNGDQRQALYPAGYLRGSLLAD